MELVDKKHRILADLFKIGKITLLRTSVAFDAEPNMSPFTTLE